MMGICSAAFGLPSICHGKQRDDILSLGGQKGNLGQIRGYIEAYP